MVPEGRNERPGLVCVDRSRLVRDRDSQLFQRFCRLPRPDEEQREVEADDGRPWKLARQRPEPPERMNGRPLRERTNRRRGLHLRIVRGELRSFVELAFRRYPALELPEREAVPKLRLRVRLQRAPREEPELRGERRRTRLTDRRDDERQAGLERRVEEVLGLDRLRRVGIARIDPPPGARRVRNAARPEVRHAEIELGGRALRMGTDETLERVETPL